MEGLDEEGGAAADEVTHASVTWRTRSLREATEDAEGGVHWRQRKHSEFCGTLAETVGCGARGGWGRLTCSASGERGGVRIQEEERGGG